MSDKVFATDDLINAGRITARGDEVKGLTDEQREALLETGQISTTEPSDPVAPSADAPAAASISDASSEELLAELIERGDGPSDETVEEKSVEDVLAEVSEKANESTDDELVEVLDLFNGVRDAVLVEAHKRGISPSGVKYDDHDKADVEKFANERELHVERTDGKAGDLRKDDYVAALLADDYGDDS